MHVFALIESLSVPFRTEKSDCEGSPLTFEDSFDGTKECFLYICGTLFITSMSWYVMHTQEFIHVKGSDACL